MILVLTAAYPSEAEPFRARSLHLMFRSLVSSVPVVVLTPLVYRSDARSEELDGVRIIRYPYAGAPRRPKFGINPAGLITYNTNAFLYALSTSLKLRPKLLYANWVIPFGVLALAVSKLLKVPFVLHIHGTDFYDYGRAPFGLLWRAALKNATAVFSAGEVLKERCEERFGCEVQNAGVGIDIDTIEEKKKVATPLRVRLGISPDTLVCTFCGDLSSSKGVDVFCEAARRLLFRYPDFFFVVIGDGPLLKSISSDSLGGMRVTGPLPPDETLSYLVVSDVFVLPSRSEGLPSALVEALVAGCVPVVSSVGDCPRLVEDGTTGFVIKNRSVSELMRCLLALRDRRRLEKMKDAIRVKKPFLGVLKAVSDWRRRILETLESL